MPRCDVSDAFIWEIIERILNGRVPAGHIRMTYYSFLKEARGIIRQGDNQSSIGSVINKYQAYGADPQILSYIVEGILKYLRC
jgi:hypothetical protein